MVKPGGGSIILCRGISGARHDNLKLADIVIVEHLRSKHNYVTI